MTAATSFERLSDLIGAIYDCALEPELWPRCLEAMRLEMNFQNASLSLIKMPEGTMLLNFNTGIEKKWQDLLPAYGSAAVEQWGGLDNIFRLPVHEPAILSHVHDRSIWERQRYFLEWVEPQGLNDAMAMRLSDDQISLGSLAFGRSRSAGPITGLELNMARLLLPHVQRAVAISRLLDIKSLEAASFAATLDTLSAAVMLVDKQLHIIHANSAARTQLGAGGSIGSYGGRLMVANPAAGAALAVAVSQAGEDEALIARRGFGVPLQSADGNPSVLHVLPLKFGERRPGISPNAVAAIFMAPALSPPSPPTEALAALFDLTPAESRVLDLIA